MKKKIKVLISACLLGDNVKYSGGNNLTPELVTLLEKYNVDIVKVCPECFGTRSKRKLAIIIPRRRDIPEAKA